MKTVKFLMMALLISTTGVKAQSPKELFLTLTEFALKSKAPEAQIIDARTPEEFAQNHLKNAINVNIASSSYQAEFEKLSKDRPTFVYSIANGRSVSLAKELRNKGFKEVNVLPGGIANWIGSGYPIVNNSKKGVAISTEQFSTLTNSSEYVLVDFGSKYCGACKKLVPVLDTLEKQKAFAAKIVKVEAYDNTELIKSLKINQLPTLVLFKNNKEVWRKAGQSTSNEISKLLKSYQSKTEVAKAGK